VTQQISRQFYASDMNVLYEGTHPVPVPVGIGESDLMEDDIAANFLHLHPAKNVSTVFLKKFKTYQRIRESKIYEFPVWPELNRDVLYLE